MRKSNRLFLDQRSWAWKKKKKEKGKKRKEENKWGNGREAGRGYFSNGHHLPL